MSNKEKIYFLIKEYLKGNYTTEVFCDEYTVIYNTEIDYPVLTTNEYNLFRDLC